MGEKRLLEGISPKLEGMDRFLSDMGSGMLFPAIPLFATAVLGAPALLIGLAESLPGFLAGIPALFPEKLKSRKLRAASIAVCAAAKALTAYSPAFPEFLLLRSADSASEECAFAGEGRPSGKLPFGLHLQNHGGKILGAILALLLLLLMGAQPGGDSFRTIILLSSIPAFLAIIPLMVKEEKYAPEHPKENAPPLPQPISAPLAISAVFHLSKIGIILFLLGAAATLSPVLVILSYLIFLASRAAFPLPAQVLRNALGQKKAFMLGCMLFSMAALSFSLPPDAQLSLLLFAFLGFSSTLLDAASRGGELPLAGNYPLLSGALLIGANLIAGILWGQHFAQMHLPFLFSSALGLASVFAFALYADED